ncbi:hypothetical protein Tsp_06899 [Trichinella spiralis]|uniref:hypothetical protein n=1 Tax=Trichinella spiralis TaxID=6334 RepID=UPI0001EFCC04|nr:hypothetical protein Tsp_06899 [Trichinella spiralis]
MSYCFKRDVTKLQTIKMKIDRMRRKENPLGWALPQQSIKGLIVNNLAIDYHYPSVDFRGEEERLVSNFEIVRNCWQLDHVQQRCKLQRREKVLRNNNRKIVHNARIEK